MRLLAAVLACVVLAASAIYAQSPVQSPADGKTIGELLGQLPRPDSDRVRSKVVSADTTATAFLFPSAGSLPGAFGTYWRTDATLVNYRSADQRIAVGWLAQGVDNSQSPLQYYVIPARTPVIVADFVAQQLGKSGLGSVVVTAVTSTGDPDTSATLDGFSRIWSPQPNATGTVSLSFPGVTLVDSLGSVAAYGLGLRQDTQYRTNVGIVNTDSVSHTWTVSINGLHGSGSFTITVPPLSMRQVPLPSGDYGDLLISLQADATGFWWSAYGVSVDNLTGDGWVSHVMQP